MLQYIFILLHIILIGSYTSEVRVQIKHLVHNESLVLHSLQNTGIFFTHKPGLTEDIQFMIIGQVIQSSEMSGTGQQWTQGWNTAIISWTTWESWFSNNTNLCITILL